METGIVFKGRRGGIFEVDGIPTEVPDDASPEEVRDRLVGRGIVSADGDPMKGYVLRLSDGQLVEFSGIWCNDSTADVSVRFWKGPTKP